MAATAKAKNRAIRQEALREQLSSQGHVQHLVDIAKKLQGQAETLEPTQIQALKAAADIHAKLINKYLPDLRATEITGPDGAPLVETISDADLEQRIRRAATEAGISLTAGGEG